MEELTDQFTLWILHLDIKYFRTEKSILGTFCLKLSTSPVLQYH